jgi:hypothetical protein
LETADED